MVNMNDRSKTAEKDGVAELTQRVKVTTFRENDSIIGDNHYVPHSHHYREDDSSDSGRRLRSSIDGSDNSQRTLNSQYGGLAGSNKMAAEEDTTDRLYHHYPKDNLVLDVDAAGLYPSSARTVGDATRYESSRSSSSSRHSSAQWSTRDEVQSLESVFDRLIEMSAIPENSHHIINSEGLDTLVAVMYPESCFQCGDMPLHQIFHPTKRKRKAQSMKAISDIYTNLGDHGRRYYKVHKHVTCLIQSMESLMDTYIRIRSTTDEDISLPDVKPLNSLIVLTKYSFDGEYRTVMNDLGVIFAVAEFITLCHIYHPIAFSYPEHGQIDLEQSLRYGTTLLTNVTCGDHHVKSAISLLLPFLEVLVIVLNEPFPQDVYRTILSLIRNLSWKASSQSKDNFSHLQICSALVKLGLQCTDETTLKVLTGALWNLSAHNEINKEIICNEGLEFLGSIVTQPVQRNTTVLENTLGILRNVSSHIAQDSGYRLVLRELGIVPRLVDFLRSNNDTILSTSTGTLWNISARSHSDQIYLRDCGAIPILRALSLHPDKSINRSATGALRNIMSAQNPPPMMNKYLDERPRTRVPRSRAMTSSSLSPSSSSQHFYNKSPTPSEDSRIPLSTGKQSSVNASDTENSLDNINNNQHIWADSLSFVGSSTDSRTSNPSPHVYRRVEGRHSSKLRLSGNKFSC